MSKINLADLSTITGNETSAINTINNNSTLIETFSDNTLSRDGTTPNHMLDDLDMNSHSILNLPVPTTAAEPLRLQDLSDFIGGGSIVAGAPTNASYVTLGTNSTLSNERVLTAGSNISLTDAGAGSTLTVAVANATGSFVPVITCDTPGNLTVAYTTQLGSYVKIGSLVICNFSILTSTFTHSTASGVFHITGFPFTAAAGINTRGAMSWGGITKANYTDAFVSVQQSSTQANVSMSGSGQTNVSLSITDFPTAGIVALSGSVSYFV